MTGFNRFLGPILATQGYAVMSLNKRDSHRYYFSSIFEHCEADIRGAVDFMQGMGQDRVILAGHSHGATEAVYYSAKTLDPRVCALALFGAPLDFGPAKNKFIRKARTLMKEDGYLTIKSDDGRTYAMTARHYVSHRSPDTNNSIARWIGSVRIPILVVAHEKSLSDVVNVQTSRKILAMAKNSSRAEFKLVKGADHGFHGYEEKTAKILSDWLGRVS